MTKAQSSSNRRTLHVLGVPHTIPNDDYSVCAFTAKILKFPEIVQPFGWRVIEYSNEGSLSRANKHEVVIETETFKNLSRRRSRNDSHEIDFNNEALQKEFQRNLLEKVKSLAKPGEIICHVFGPNMEVYNNVPSCHHIEINVGYTASPGLPFRIYESSAWMHWHHGKAGREDGSHYHWVIPSGFDISKWPYCENSDDYAVFLGRLTLRKGMNELIEIARRMPDLSIRAYGPGDATTWQNQAPKNLQFRDPVFGSERLRVIQNARCMLMPTVFIEPFGNSGVEAQLCGVPLIASSFGAFNETIVEGVTGFKCHTLADWTEAIRLSQKLDRKHISEIAASKYAIEKIGNNYNWVFEQLADLSEQGWYGYKSRKFNLDRSNETDRPKRDRRIWLYMPYFGSLPNYFQLYLDSLSRNDDCLSVIMITDIDLSCYKLPENLFIVPMDFSSFKNIITAFIKQQFDLERLNDCFLMHPYKLCDFKIIYPEMLYNIGADVGVLPDDFVGWGDCDLIYGKLSNFIDLSDESTHLIGGMYAHFTAFRNLKAMRTLFLEVPDLISKLEKPDYQVVDERDFRIPLFEYIGKSYLKAYEVSKDICDVVPECFFWLFRKDHADRKTNFFEVRDPSRELDYIFYDKDGILTTFYTDGTCRQSAYCHLQKRKMSVDFERGDCEYFIKIDSFSAKISDKV